MARTKPLVSIIIVHYRVKEALFSCLRSIKKYEDGVSYEVIVVDNDEVPTIGLMLKKRFPWAKYVSTQKNIGYGAGNNRGAEIAKGEYLFFLNPDTLFHKNTMQLLLSFFKKHKDTGIAAPLLLNKKEEPYSLQGTMELTPINGFVSLSFINKFFPRNPISRKYWLFDWDKKDPKEVSVVPGTAFMIKKDIFVSIGGFDERFFLYFEESDLCKRVKDIGYTIYMVPKAHVTHLWGESTKHMKQKNNYFAQSRYLYFKKHFGFLSAQVVEFFLGDIKTNIFVLALLVFALLIRIYKLDELMPFIGDQGWFYLSARDMILTKQIPLVGITSSHIWLHQGPLWTYVVALLFLVFGFDPRIPAYFSAIVSVFTVWILYIVTKKTFSKRAGIIAALLYAASPLVVVHARLPYHTGLIPLFVILYFYVLVTWIRNRDISMVPWIVGILLVLYNLELATAVLMILTAAIFFYGYIKKFSWARGVLQTKIIVKSILVFVFIMLPIIIYDTQHGFVQTVRFAGWMVYQVAKIFFSQTASHISFLDMGTYFLTFLQKLLFVEHALTAIIFFFLSILFLFTKSISSRKPVSYVILLLVIVVPFFAFIFNRVPSEAYLPLLFPVITLALALLFDQFMLKGRIGMITKVLLISIIATNSIVLLNRNYFMGQGGYGATLQERISIAKQIVDESNRKAYNLIGKGNGSQFSSFTMNYEYLTWWLGHAPSKKQEPLIFSIEETDKIIVRKIQRK